MTLGLFGRASALAARGLPRHYVTPTSEYLVPKALKDVTSRLFFAMERLHVHVLPEHFYTPVPDYAWLRAHRSAWDRPAAMTGVVWDLDEQLGWLESICRTHLHEVQGLRRYNAIVACGFGPGYGPIDAQVLHCAIRSLRPRRVVEIGSGVSTATMAGAAQMNVAEGHARTEVLAIDPYPRPAIRDLPAVRVIAERVQLVEDATFEDLAAGDLLFIDSSHAVKIGSDVNRLFLEVIPRLKPGVFVHIHDISLPYLYPRTALSDYFGWQE
ncbi:MAG: class I SAM-dependent methyltransferase [Thermomicrobiales bacterium]